MFHTDTHGGRFLLRGLCTLGALVSCLVSTPSIGYRYYQTQGVPSEPWRWWHRAEPLVFHVATVGPEEIPLADVPTIVKAAFDTWTDTACGVVPEVVFGGTVDVTATTAPSDIYGEADNIVLFVRSAAEWTALGHSQAELAITKVFADPDTGEIVDADTEINDAGFKFVTADAPEGPGEIDFIGTMVHQAGHFFGMDHSTDATATMSAAYPAPTPGDPHPERSLAQDDIDGICELYREVPEHVVPVEPGPENAELAEGTASDDGASDATAESTGTGEPTGTADTTLTGDTAEAADTTLTADTTQTSGGRDEGCGAADAGPWMFGLAALVLRRRMRR